MSKKTTPITDQQVPALKPSAFCEFPYDSRVQKTEAEIVACNMMKIRRRTGDKWPLSWEAYVEERKKDTGFTEGEKFYFDQVSPLIADAIGAISFSTVWANAARAVITKGASL